MIDSFQGRYRFLSNFYPCKILYFGICYPTLEHAFQAAKTDSKLERLKISQAVTPAQAKRMGRKVSLRINWEHIKDGIMLVLLRRKFREEPLGARLLKTGKQRLVEGNTWGDKYWGECSGEGENRLGKLLMKVRQELKT